MKNVNLSRREQIILVVTSALVLTLVVFRWGGLGSTLGDLRAQRRTLANLQRETADQRDQLENFPRLVERYEQYDNISLLTAEGNPADVFLEYASAILERIDLARPARIRPPEEEEVENVDNYVQILLPIEFEARWDDVLQVLTTFDQQRLLIRELEITSRDNAPETDMRVRLTLSRFVRLEEEPDDDGSSRSRAGWGGRS